MPGTLSLAERHWLAMADPQTLDLPPGPATVVSACHTAGLIEQTGTGDWRLSQKGERFRFASLQHGNGLQPAAS